MGVQYRELQGLDVWEKGKAPVVVCSIGDAAMTEGEVSEALQMAVLKQLPILFFVQDNEWDISANAKETRAQNAAEFASGFNGLEIRSLDSNDFAEVYEEVQDVLGKMRSERRPFLMHLKVPLLGHHTQVCAWNGTVTTWKTMQSAIPAFALPAADRAGGGRALDRIVEEADRLVKEDYQKALAAEDPGPMICIPMPIRPHRSWRSLGIDVRMGRNPP